MFFYSCILICQIIICQTTPKRPSFYFGTKILYSSMILATDPKTFIKVVPIHTAVMSLKKSLVLKYQIKE